MKFNFFLQNIFFGSFITLAHILYNLDMQMSFFRKQILHINKNFTALPFIL